MSDAFIAAIVSQLGTILERQIREELNLVMGVEKQTQKLTSTFKCIEALISDAEKKQVTNQSVRIWLENLRDVLYDMDDVLSDWSNALLKIEIEGIQIQSVPRKKFLSYITLPCFFVGRVVHRRDIAKKINEIDERLGAIAIEKDRYGFSFTSIDGPERIKTTSFVDVSEVRGRNADKSVVLSKLLGECCQELGLEVISILGMGGIGKTTLAQLIHSSVEDKGHFDVLIWVCVSEPFDQVRIAKAILEVVERKAPDLFELETVLLRIRTSLSGKKFLLILDDVWNEEYRLWEPLYTSLKSVGNGSKVLVTTRNKRVAETMRSTFIHPLGQLSDEDCWCLFKQRAFFNRSEKECKDLEGIGREISDKCQGLPLAAKTIGGLMHFKYSKDEWQNVLHSETWKLELEKDLFPPLLLSYYELPSVLKRCFAYCANFPKDFKIEADNLIKLWMAQGYIIQRGNEELEKTGWDYLDNLIMRSFFQDVKRDKERGSAVSFKMHDMVHDFAQSLTKKESFTMEGGSGLESRMNSSCGKARHLTLLRGDDVSFPLSIGSTEKLHFFWIQAFHHCPPILSAVDKVPPAFFRSLANLKALDLSHNRLSELPKEMGDLINLRYLNLSHNPLSELPETLSELYNLQTLKLISCDHLTKLPKEIGKLINLRHLEIDHTDRLKTMPKGIGKLSNLRTLTKFVLVDVGDNEGLTIDDLKNLNCLRGCLEIEGLGNVTDAEEAKRAELKNKEHLLDLHMDFSPPLAADEALTDVAEALQLHENLQSLQISCYSSTLLPTWITLLTNLRTLRLIKCLNCLSLPPLGRLSSLEKLSIKSIQSFRRMGIDFLGVGTKAELPLLTTISFPKLKKLKIVGMDSWEEWDVQENVEIMPSLCYLKLSDCRKLKTLPQPILQSQSIRKIIRNCPNLQIRLDQLIPNP